jgi:LmbE family N-acetylglucosaminyl deacetylase
MSVPPVALAVMAHPDDIEFQCAGTLLRLRALGWQVHLATMTAGDCGSVDLPPEQISAVRRAEAAAAAERLGADYTCLEQLDGLVFFGDPLVRLTVELVRRVRPQLIITHPPSDYMLDHEQCSVAMRAASFIAPAPNFSTGAAQPAAAAAQVPHLYYSDPLEGVDLYGQPVQPHCYLDISAVVDEKEALLACHASQREWLRAHHGLDEYLLGMRRWNAKRGAEVGVAYAEAFRQHRGHAYPPDDLLSSLLGGTGS